MKEPLTKPINLLPKKQLILIIIFFFTENEHLDNEIKTN